MKLVVLYYYGNESPNGERLTLKNKKKSYLMRLITSCPTFFVDICRSLALPNPFKFKFECVDKWFSTFVLFSLDHFSVACCIENLIFYFMIRLTAQFYVRRYFSEIPNWTIRWDRIDSISFLIFFFNFTTICEIFVKLNKMQKMWKKYQSCYCNPRSSRCAHTIVMDRSLGGNSAG